MSYTNPTLLPIRNLDEIRKTDYLELNSAEIKILEQQDPAAYREKTSIFDPPVTVAPETEAVQPRGRVVIKNGQIYDESSAIRFVNGIPQ